MSINKLLGDFTVFGFTKNNPELLKHKLAERLGIAPCFIDFGPAGHFFFHTSNGDVVETEEMIALKLGFARSLNMSPLTTRQLVEQKMVTPRTINNAGFRGNGLIACFSKVEPAFSVYSMQKMPICEFLICNLFIPLSF